MNDIQRIKDYSANQKEQPDVTGPGFYTQNFLLVLIYKVQTEKRNQKAMWPTRVTPFSYNIVYLLPEKKNEQRGYYA